jgi:hypothetical protein
MVNNYMKMFNMFSQQRMQIKTTLRFHLNQAEWLTIRKETMINAGENVGRKGPLYIVGGNVN